MSIMYLARAARLTLNTVNTIDRISIDTIPLTVSDYGEVKKRVWGFFG